ncbi:MAG: M28 family metallopeptidase [Heyndrickxia sp.]
MNSELSILSNRLSKDIAFLTARETEGRVSGSIGAKVAANYLANRLAELGAKPAGEDEYFTYLDVVAARLKGEVTLKIGGKKLIHRKDFGEISRYSNSSGNHLSGKLLVVRDGDDVEPDELKGKVVLIPEIPKDFDLPATVKAAEKIGIQALLINGGERRWFHKTALAPRENSIPVFRIHNQKVSVLVESGDQEVEIHLPLITEGLMCQNVLGLFPGKNPSKTLVISAHYDHVGDDPNGFRFPGAVDNASGVAIVLEIARKLSGRLLPFNMLIAFFTGEESGLIGAKHFVKNTTLPINAVINIDSLGFEPSLVQMRNGHENAGNWLADLSAEVIQNHGVEVARITGGEDSVAFQKEGITAIGLGQKPTDPTQRGIHSPDDNVENIYYRPVEQALEVTRDIIKQIIENPERVLS